MAEEKRRLTEAELTDLGHEAYEYVGTSGLGDDVGLVIAEVRQLRAELAELRPPLDSEEDIRRRHAADIADAEIGLAFVQAVNAKGLTYAQAYAILGGLVSHFAKYQGRRDRGEGLTGGQFGGGG